MFPYVLLLAPWLLASCQGQKTAPQPKGVRLLYTVDSDAMRLRGMKTPDAPVLVATVIDVLRKRLTQAGIDGFELDEVGKSSLDVRLPPPKNAKQLAYWRKLLEHTGALEVRMVATADYGKGKVFDLEAEKKRLRAWLAEPENKKLIAEDPANIARFNNRAGTPEGPASKFLRWAPLRRQPGKKSGTWNWQSSFSPNEVGHFLPLNLHEPTWLNESDFVREKFAASGTMPPGGALSLTGVIRPARVAAWADLTGRSIGQRVAIFVDDAIVIAPVIRERLSGGTMVVGRMGSDGSVKASARVLQAGGPRIVLRLDKQEVVR